MVVTAVEGMHCVGGEECVSGIHIYIAVGSVHLPRHELQHRIKGRCIHNYIMWSMSEGYVYTYM